MSKIPNDKSHLVDQNITIDYDLCLSGRIHIQSGKTMTISAGKILYIHEKAILLNEGTLIIESGAKVYVHNSGVLISNGTITNNGEINSPPAPGNGNGSNGEFGNLTNSFDSFVLTGTFGGVVAMTIIQSDIDMWNGAASSNHTHTWSELSDSKLTVAVGGNVGIGTSTPSTKLEVAGNAKITSLGGSGAQMVVTDNTGLLSKQAIPGGGSYAAKNIIVPFAFAYINTVSAGTGTNMSWGAYNSGTSRVHITFDEEQPDSNYIVVTDSAMYDLYQLIINNKNKTGFDVDFTNQEAPAYVNPWKISPADHPGTIMVYSSNPVVSVNIGEQGIQGIQGIPGIQGVPGSSLWTEIVGGIYYVGDVTCQGEIKLRTENTTLRGNIKVSNVSPHLNIATSGGEDIAFRDGGVGGTINMFIGGVNGNVGIGTASPNAKLDVRDGHIYVGDDTFSNPGGWDTTINIDSNIHARMLIEERDTGTQTALWAHTGGNAAVGTLSNHDFDIVTNNNSKIRVEAGGNIGIGNNNPLYKLDVSGGGRFTDNLFCEGYIQVDDSIILKTAGGVLRGWIKASEDSPHLDIATSGGEDIAFRDGGLDGDINMIIMGNGGNVGIGTSSPGVKLEVVGSAKISTLGGNGNRMVVTDTNGVLSTQAIPSGGTGNGPFDNNGEMNGHIIPHTNAIYDLGDAEHKIRHLFLSDNSLWVGDNHKISVDGGKMKFVKRKSSIPTYVNNIAPSTQFTTEHANGANISIGNSDHTLAFNYINYKFQNSNLTASPPGQHSDNTTLAPHHWEAYVQAFVGYATKTISDIYPNGNFENDFEEELLMGGIPVKPIDDIGDNKISYDENASTDAVAITAEPTKGDFNGLVSKYNALRAEVMELKGLLLGVLRFTHNI